MFSGVIILCGFFMFMGAVSAASYLYEVIQKRHPEYEGILERILHVD